MLNQFLAINLPLKTARAIIDQIGQIGQITIEHCLEQPVNEAHVILSLAKHPSLKQITFYLCKLKPTILAWSFDVACAADDSEPSTLLELFNKNPTQYQNILEWIKQEHPEFISAGEPATKKLYILRKKLLGYMESGESDRFKTLLQDLDPQTVSDIMHLELASNAFMAKALEAGIPYLTVLIEIDMTVLRITVDDQMILDVLCGNSEHYQTILETVLKKYSNLLSKSELSLMNRSLKLESSFTPLETNTDHFLTSAATMDHDNLPDIGMDFSDMDSILPDLSALQLDDDTQLFDLNEGVSDIYNTSWLFQPQKQPDDKNQPVRDELELIHKSKF